MIVYGSSSNNSSKICNSSNSNSCSCRCRCSSSSSNSSSSSRRSIITARISGGIMINSITIAPSTNGVGSNNSSSISTSCQW